jgi:O-acetyl-ADP-ribose deacetylase (regulator of RNase III)
VKSIAFPAISTGVYSYPKDEAARIAIGVMREFEDRFEKVVACLHGENDLELYREIL